MAHRDSITEALSLIFNGIAKLKERFPSKSFAIDGRLVGDIGEIIASEEYDLTLYPVQTAEYDGYTSDGRKVQVKATFKKHLAMTNIPDFLLGIQLFTDGSYLEVYNGPGELIAQRFAHRSGLGEKQLSFPVSVLQEISSRIPDTNRIPRRILSKISVS